MIQIVSSILNSRQNSDYDGVSGFHDFISLRHILLRLLVNFANVYLNIENYSRIVKVFLCKLD